MTRLTLATLHNAIGITPDTLGYGKVFGKRSRTLLDAKLSNREAPALAVADYRAAAERLGVPVGHIKGVRSIEAPRGPYDDNGRPAILFERHRFRLHTEPLGCFDETHYMLSGPSYGPGGYGPFSAQYGRLYDACALDCHAAFSACSWGAFQVMGEHAERLGYGNAWDMALTLTTGEAAHLETFVRYVETFGLVDEFRACRPGDNVSCQPFVKGYNGPGYKRFKYDTKLAAAI